MKLHSPFGNQLPSILTKIPGIKSTFLSRQLQKVEASGVTYVAKDFPIFWEQSKGANIRDVDGNVYIDLSAAFSVASVGHANHQVAKAIHHQLRKLPHGMGDVHPPAIKVELLKSLVTLLPQANAKAFLSSTGSEAVETALKTARLTSKKPGVIYFRGSYHGLSYGTLSVAGQTRFRQPFENQISQHSYMAEFPCCNENSAQDTENLNRSISELEKIIDRAKKSPYPIGALLVEPIQGRGGINIPPKGWLKKVHQLLQYHKILLIADEIMTGFGRTGKFFAVEHDEITPDLLCIGKSLTGTMPFSACMGPNESWAGWKKSTGEAIHTSTFLGHPLGCAAALAVIKEIKNKNLVERARFLGDQLISKMKEWSLTHSVVKNVRGRGLMIGIELQDKNNKKMTFQISKLALQKGLIVLPCGETGNVLSITPPFTITKHQIDYALSALFNILNNCKK